MADLGGIAGLLNSVVQRSVELQSNDINDDAENNRTTTETEGNTESAGAGTTSGSATVGEGLAFQPIQSTGTDQTTNSDFTGSAGRVIEDQVTISAEARSAFEQAQADQTQAGQTQAGQTETRTPAEALQEEATNPAQNLAFRADSAEDAATIEGADEVEAAAEQGRTNQAETNERDTGVVVGNTDVTALSAQNRELGQLVDQFA